MDPGVTATTMLANVNWLLGELGQTRELIEEGVTRAVESGHVPTQGFAYTIKVLLEAVRGDAEATLRASAASLDREHTIDVYLPLGFAFSSWARAQLGERETGLMGLRRALTEYANKGNKLFLPFCHGLLAEVEATVDGAEKALAQIDGALALAGDTGEHWTDAILHRVRGEILLKRDPTNTAPAEEAFLTAIAIAQQQTARSFELRAALSLAKLYQSTGRAADAHAVLARALEGFSPTPEFAEIAEAYALLAELIQSDAAPDGFSG
jgi:predicted ATPase